MENHSPPHEAGMFVERTARLFQAGRYEDKGIEIDPEQIDRMASAFIRPVPVCMEHTEGPLRFGWLMGVWRKGAWLFGRLIFSRSAWELIRQSGAGSLSVALDRQTLSIREVSLVRNPRVVGAQVFHQSQQVVFSFQLSEETGMEDTPEINNGGQMTQTQHNQPEGSHLEGEVARLKADLRRRKAQETLEVLMSRGKVAPAAKDDALALLSTDDAQTLCFSDGTDITVAGAFQRFLEKQPPVVIFAETTPAGPRKASGFSQQDRRIFSLLDVTEEDVQQFGSEKEDA